ncbi:MFS transporter [Micromonospora sp. NPDC050200]|uniref:MFS transporter n=1 Tax=Micromonospora sp. NPDC050200 TaxID=3155664 RepID=UPI0033E3075C
MLPATSTDRLGFGYLGLIVQSVAVCFLQPAVRAVTPTIVDQADLPAANSLTAFSTAVLRMAGPLAGTFLVARGWFAAAVAVDLVAYLGAALATAGVAVARQERSAGRAARAIGELREGLGRIARTPVLRGLLVTSWLYWTANAALTVLLIPYATERLDASGAVVGWLVAGLGVGHLVGSLLSRTLVARYPTRTVLAGAYAGVGAAFLVMFSTTSVPVALAAVLAVVLLPARDMPAVVSAPLPEGIPIRST